MPKVRPKLTPVAAYAKRSTGWAALSGTYHKRSDIKAHATTPATAGFFGLNVGAEFTGSVIPFDATPAQVVAALEGLSNVAPGDVSAVMLSGTDLGDAGAVMELNWSGGAFANSNPTVGIQTGGLTGNAHTLEERVRQRISLPYSTFLIVKGYVIELSGATALDTITGTCRHTIGITDGTTSRCVGYFGETGELAANADTRYSIGNLSVLLLPSLTGSSVRAIHVAMYADGIEIEFTHGYIPTSQFLGQVEFIMGGGASAKVVSFAGNPTQNLTATSPSLGFQLDGGYAIGCGRAFSGDDLGGTEGELSIGFFGRLSSLTQGCGVVCAEHQEANTSSGSYGRSDAVAIRLTSTAKTVAVGAWQEVTAIGSDDFTVTTRNASDGFETAYLLFSFGGVPVFVGFPTLATSSTGVKSVTAPGFRVGSLSMVSLRIVALDTVNSAAGGGSICFGFADVSGRAGSCSSLFRDNVTSSTAMTAASNTEIAAVLLTNVAYDWNSEIDELNDVGFDYDVIKASPADRPTLYMAVEEPITATMVTGAGPATVALDVDLIRQTSVTAQAATATAAIAGQKRFQIAVTTQAVTATTAVAGQLVHQAAVAVQAAPASVTIDADVIRQASLATSADTATVALDTDVIRQTSTAAQADTATVALDVDLIHQTSVTAQADTATTSIAGTVDSAITATVAAQADTATVALDTDVIRQTSVTLQADTATTAAVAQRVLQASPALQADTATAASAGQRVVQASVAVQADTATVAITTQLAHQTAIALQAETATVALDVDLVHQTSITLQADTATVTLDVDLLRHASVALQADTATVALDVDLIHQTSVTAQAATATTVISAELVGAVSADVAAQADTATASAAGQLVHQASPTVQADTATAAVAAQLLRQTSVTVAATTATVALDVDLIHQTSVTAQADTATVAITGTVFQIRSADLALQADTATAAVSGQKISQSSLALQADISTVVISTAIVRQADVATQADTATVGLDVDLIHQTSVTAQADTATASAAGDVANVLGSVTAQADTATAAIAGQVVRQTSPTVQADTATTAFAAQLAHQTSTSVSASPATVSISTVLGAETRQGSALVQAQPAFVGVVGQRIVQGAVGVQASTAVARAYDEFEPLLLSAPAALYFMDWPTKQIATAVTLQASIATVSIQGEIL